jgi:hypothetical protein
VDVVGADVRVAQQPDLGRPLAGEVHELEEALAHRASAPSWIFQKIARGFILPRRFGGALDILISRHGFTFTPVCLS